MCCSVRKSSQAVRAVAGFLREGGGKGRVPNAAWRPEAIIASTGPSEVTYPPYI